MCTRPRVRPPRLDAARGRRPAPARRRRARALRGRGNVARPLRPGEPRERAAAPRLGRNARRPRADRLPVPLAHRRRLPDAGFAIARPVGLLLVALARLVAREPEGLEFAARRGRGLGARLAAGAVAIAVSQPARARRVGCARAGGCSPSRRPSSGRLFAAVPARPLVEPRPLAPVARRREADGPRLPQRGRSSRRTSRPTTPGSPAATSTTTTSASSSSARS